MFDSNTQVTVETSTLLLTLAVTCDQVPILILCETCRLGLNRSKTSAGMDE